MVALAYNPIPAGEVAYLAIRPSLWIPLLLRQKGVLVHFGHGMIVCPEDILSTLALLARLRRQHRQMLSRLLSAQSLESLCLSMCLLRRGQDWRLASHGEGILHSASALLNV